MSVFILTNTKVPDQQVISHSSKGLKGVKSTIKNMLRQYETFISTGGKSKQLDFFKIFSQDTKIDDINISPYTEEKTVSINNEQTLNVSIEPSTSSKPLLVNYDGLKQQRQVYENQMIELQNDINLLEQQIKLKCEQLPFFTRKIFLINEICKYSSMFNE